MKLTLTSLSVLLFSISTFCQSNWTYYCQDYWVQDINVVDDIIYVGNPTGFHAIDINTKESKLYQSVNSELRGSFIWEMLATDDHVWVALNEGGIAKYNLEEYKLNGYWQQFYTPLRDDSDARHMARNLIETEDGTLWFGTSRSGHSSLLSLSDGTIHDHTDLFTEQAYNMSCHGSKRMFFKSDNSPLNYVDLETKEIIQIPLPNSFDEAHSFTAYKDDLYVSFSDSLGYYLYVYDNEWIKLYNTDEVVSFWNAERGKNHIWINDYSDNPGFIKITAGGVEKYKLEDLTEEHINTGFRTVLLNEERNGRLWFSTNDSYTTKTFIFSILNGKVEYYNISHSALKFSVTTGDHVDFDCDGNLIIPNPTRVQVFDPDTLTIIDILENRQSGDIEMVASDPTSCRYYIGQDGFSNRTSNIYVFENQELVDTIVLEDTGLYDIIVSQDGQLIAATFQFGIGLYNENTEEWSWHRDPLYDPQLNRYNGIWNMEAHVTGAITFGTWRSLVVYDKGTWTTFDSSNSPLDGETILTHIIDSKGQILVEFKGGIYKYDGNEWEYTAFFDPYKNGIRDIYEDDNGNYWLGTFNSGLLYWNGFTYIQYDIMNSAIPSNQITKILPHPITNDLWLIADRGIVIFDRDDYTYKKGVFGKVFYDSEKDSDYDIGNDAGIPDVFVDMKEETVLTDINGNYAFYPTEQDSITIECNVPDDYESTSPTVIITEFQDEDIFDANFGMWKELETAELEHDLSVSPFLCASDISVWMTLKNPGLETVDGRATLTMPNDIRIKSTFPEADIVSGNSATWTFDKLSYLEQRKLYAIVEGPTVEDILTQHDSIDEVFIDIISLLEYDGLSEEYINTVPFLCAYDPNDKMAVSDGPSVDNFSLLEDDLIYTIRFQNEGNYKAKDVIITDTLSMHLDPRSIEIISSSHTMQTQLKNEANALVFRFIDINLPPKSENEAASQGYIKFKISPISNIVDNTVINNSASIYFDNNAPIHTNITENILVEDLSVSTDITLSTEDTKITLFPNPSNDHFELYSTANNYHYSVYDTDGRKLSFGNSKNGYTIIDIEHPGIYFIVINLDHETQTIKIVKI